MAGAGASKRRSRPTGISAPPRTRTPTPPQVSDADVRVLSGEEEGAFGWAQANYLLDRLGLLPNETLAVIDMGGGSMQVRLNRQPPPTFPE